MTRYVIAAIGLTVVSAGLAHADDPSTTKKADDPKLREEMRRLVGVVQNAGYYGLRDPKEKQAVETLRKHPEYAAPLIAQMLSAGLQTRSSGWIQVYRPLYIMRGMGPAAKVALPDIIKALDDQHFINVVAAAELLLEIGPEARDAVPALIRARDRAKVDRAKNSLAAVIKKLDPEAAAKAGIE
jgi:hypothetical protein